MSPIILFSHSQRQCGVQQFGKQIFEALRDSTKYEFVYCEVGSPAEVRAVTLAQHARAALFNFHPVTIGWAAGWTAWSLQIPTVGIMHEMTTELAEQVDDTLFDYYIFHDPSAKPRNPLFFTAGRVVLPPSKTVSDLPAPSRFTIGSFGFATAGKGFEALTARAHAEFDDCLIRLNIPASEFCDKDGSQARIVAERCRSIISKPGVNIEITHDFMSLNDVQNYLARNTLNAFFYEDQEARGISSAVDLALSARRPIALRRSSMFRHMFDAKPSIFIEERSLRDIAESGLAPLQPFIERWTPEGIRADYEKMFDAILSRETEATARLRWYQRAAKVEQILSAHAAGR
ncbi:MAG: hypothetical protein ACYC5H_03105 [Methylovirgula sp.]